MSGDLHLRRKWTLRAHGQQVVFVKRPVESTRHVLMKAFLWALYLPIWPTLLVEVPIGGRYKPDLVALDPYGQPLFWGECGHVGFDKLETIVRKHPTTHFALARWSQPLSPVVALVERALGDGKTRRGKARSAPCDVLVFPDDAGERFIDREGRIRVTFEDIAWERR
jgi:hypothetical protein